MNLVNNHVNIIIQCKCSKCCTCGLVERPRSNLIGGEAPRHLLY
nr:MAG TPA: hypothetical protein [Caudoviricetes sp.]